MFDRGIATFITSGEVAHLSVSIATDSRDQNRGLLDAGAEFKGDVGMVFRFDHTRPVISMQGMKIPLDILFINAAGIIICMVEDAQPDSGNYHSLNHTRWVIELPTGTARRLGLNSSSKFALRSE